MTESEFETIYRNLSLKDTEELIGYWQKNDKEEWTAIAIDVMEKILIERLGNLPDKIEIEKEFSTIEKEPEEKTNAFVDLKAILLDNEPVFYDPKKVTTLVKWIFRSFDILVVLYIIQFIFTNLPLFRAISNKMFNLSSLVSQLVLSIVGLLLVIITVFLQYKALGYILKILMEMEINSRNSNK